jgi:hypothetical protein
MKTYWCSLLALTALAAAGAGAQRIEISSESLGSVVVEPIGGTAGAPTVPAPASRTSGERGTGVDLGIRRNADGTLYDALDPNQNPAAAPGAVGGTEPGRAPATTVFPNMAPAPAPGAANPAGAVAAPER